MPAEKLPSCARCGRGARNKFTCPRCGFFSSNVFCSERCFKGHVRDAHGDELAAEAERDAREHLASALDDEADRVRGRRRPKAIEVVTGLVVLTMLSFCCCGGVAYWSADPKEIKELKEADKLYSQGKKAEAVAIYKRNFDKSKDQPLALKRIVEHEAEAGDSAEARRWVEKGMDQGVSVSYEGAAQKLAARVKSEREAQARARQAEQESQARAAKQEQDAKAKEDEKRRVAGHFRDLKSADRATKLAAIQAVAALGERAAESEPDAVRQLAEALKDTDREVRRQAFEAVVKVAGNAKAAVPGLTEALKGKDAGVRAHAAVLLRSVGPDAAEAAPALVECLADAMVRPDAVAALAAVGKPAVPSLAKGLKDRPTRLGAAQALGKIGPDAGEAAPDLVAALADADARAEAVKALGSVGKPAVPALVKGLDDGNDEVRRSAVMTLGHVGPDAEEAVARIEELARRDGSGQVREAAKVALGRIRRKK